MSSSPVGGHLRRAPGPHRPPRRGGPGRAADPARPDTRLTNWAVMARTGEHGTPPLRPEDWSRSGLIDEVLPFVRDRFRLDFVDPAELIATADGALYEAKRSGKNRTCRAAQRLQYGST